MSESRLAVYDDSSRDRAVMAVPRTVATGHLRMPSVDELSVMSTLAKAIAGSKMYPGFTTEPQAMAGMLLAYDIRRPFSQVLRNAYMIEGRLSLAAQYIAGLVMDAPGCEMRVTEQTAEQCTVTFRRPGWTDDQSFTYTIADARTAQLDGKAIWKKYPREMLVNRAFGIVARTHFPDVAAGMYTPEEVEDFDRPVMREVTSTPSRPRDSIFVEPATPEPAAALEAGSDDPHRALAGLHAAAADLGMSHDDIKQFVSEETGKPVGSMATWDLRQITWVRGLVERKGRQWVEEQGGDGGEVIDAETGEIMSADDEAFPTAPASLLSDEDAQPRSNPDRYTN